MTRLFDDETGYLLLDEIVLNRPSFQKIMEDRTITDEEVMAQADLVLSLLQKLDDTLDQEEKTIAVDAMAELAVLCQISMKRGGK